MRYSANLNIMVKAVEKASSHMTRDFIELENLQSNPASADRFAAAAYNRIKKIIFEDLSKLRPDYNMIFSDGEKIVKNQNSEYTFVIHVVDGLDNLKRANPDFTVALALEYRGQNGEKEGIAAVVNKIFGGENFYCEKGFGCYLNNRRIRVSKRQNSEILTVSNDKNYAATELTRFRNYGAPTLEMAYLACSRLEKLVYKNAGFDLYKPFLVMAREAGGKIVQEANNLIISN